jgi:hypothetical protein
MYTVDVEGHRPVVFAGYRAVWGYLHGFYKGQPSSYQLRWVVSGDDGYYQDSGAYDGAEGVDSYMNTAMFNALFEDSEAFRLYAGIGGQVLFDE